MQNKRDITLDIKTVYQILIGDLRYGYTRNNHLMPSDAYDKAKSILNLMKKTNSTWAYSTANQICEECISDQIMIHFYNGFDDEYGNLQEAIDFVEYLIKFMQEHNKEYKPYNYDLYEDLINKKKNIKYSVYKLNKEEDFLAKGIPNNSEALKSSLTLDEAYDYLLLDILGTTNGTFNNLNIVEQGRVIGKKFRILSPDNHHGELYMILRN